MANLLDILDAFTTPLKIAWVVWLAWGVAQIFWYRYERKPHIARKTPAAAPARQPFVSRPSAADRVVTRLVTPDVITHQAESIAPAPVAPAPVVDNTPGEIGELDRFVASFEMNTRHRHADPHNGEACNNDTHAGY
jgi:hypothetical protein